MAVVGGGAALLAACGQVSRPTEVPKAAAPAPTTAPAAPAKPAEAPAAAKPADAPAKPTEAPAAAKPAAGGSGPKILIRLNGISPPVQEFTNKLIGDYNRDKGTQVEVDYTDWASSFQKISTGMAGGTAPDLFMGGGLWTPVIASKQGSLELDSYLKSYKEYEDWFEVARKDVIFQGKVHALPYRANSRGNIVYRKSLFEKAGLDPKKPPTTWEEAYEYGQKLTQRSGDKWDVAGWHILFTPTDTTQQYEDALYQNGGSYFNEERTQPTNNTPEGKEALQFLLGFVEKGIIPKQGMDSGVPNLNAYSAGKVALYPGWPGEINNARLNAPAVFEDTIVGPPLKRKEQRLQLYIDKYFIYRRSKSPDQTWELLTALSKPEVNNKIGIEADWGLPIRKASADTAEPYKDPRLKVVVDNVKYGKIRYCVPQHFDVQPAMSRHVEAAVKGAKSVEQALKDMDEEVAKILKS
jgi:ABC-type glycerol-3-phosphate transport system substrate-binding protein